MGEILKKCPDGGCESCYRQDLEYENLIDQLSKMHISGIRDPETLCRARLFEEFNKDSPDFKKISQTKRKPFNPIVATAFTFS